MSASPMTPAARREAVRLLLVDFENQEREARWVWKLRTENRSVQCLRHALGLLREERPDWFKLAKWMVGRTECQPMRVDLQREIDGMLSRLAQRMPADIAVPWECIEHWRRDVSGTAADDPPSLIAQLSAAYARETHLANADSPHDDDDWQPSYTDGRIAGRLPTDGHYQPSSRLQPVGLIEGTFASDEISATSGFEIQAARDCYVPTGRPAAEPRILSRPRPPSLRLRSCLPSRLTRPFSVSAARAKPTARPTKSSRGLSTRFALARAQPPRHWPRH